MQGLDLAHLKHGGNRTTESAANHPQATGVVGSSDETGVTLDFRATPGYQDTQLTTAEVRR